MSNMKQIAAMSGVSLGTVSNVLSGSTSVGEELRRKVLLAVEQTGYQRNELARGLRREKTNMIAIIIPDIRNPFFPSVVRGAEDVAFADGYRLIICNTDNDPEREKTHLTQLRTYVPSGLVVITSNVKGFATEIEPLRRAGTAVVCVDRLPRGWDGDSMTSSNERGAREATEYLLRLGHKRLAMIAGLQHSTSFDNRRSGFKRALRERGITIRPEYIQQSGADSQSGYVTAMRLMKLRPRPTALLAGNDVIALGALRAFRELGLRCPEDVSLIGFDDLDFCEMTAPALTTVSQPGYEFGSAAATLLLQRIRGDLQHPRHVVMDTTLKLRQSVARPPG